MKNSKDNFFLFVVLFLALTKVVAQPVPPDSLQVVLKSAEIDTSSIYVEKTFSPEEGNIEKAEKNDSLDKQNKKTTKKSPPPINKDSLRRVQETLYEIDDSTLIAEGVTLSNAYVPSKKSATRAAFLSTICPGAGQFYGGYQWWMAPVFWAGLGGTIYASIYYNNFYNSFRTEYKNRINHGITDKYPYFDNASLVSRMQYAEQQRDLWIIATAGVYLLNILHANVAIQLSEFKLDKNLKRKKAKKDAVILSLSPSMINKENAIVPSSSPGVQLAISF